MTAKTIVITGASDGIGAKAAQRLAGAGHRVVVVGRSPHKTAAVATSLGAPSYTCDFAQLEQVRRLARELAADHPRIDVLVNNAGGIFGARRELTADGHELTMQVNHLAPFLLTNLLLERLRASRASVINTSSIANRVFGHIDVDDLGNECDYSPRKAYGDAKLANILFTRELHRREHERGVSTAALHPGNVASNFAAGSGSWLRWIYRTPLKHLFLVGVDAGSDNTVWLATTPPGEEWLSGVYYDGQVAGDVNEQANDPQLAAAVWQRSAELVGLA